MSFDERIDRLTERHEALVQSIELQNLENREQDKKWNLRFDKLLSIVEKTATSLELLRQNAELHQHRLDSHDDRMDKLEGTE